MHKSSHYYMLLISGIVVALSAYGAVAKEIPTLELAYYSIDNVVLLMCAVLVLFMQAGFAALEAGMSPANNTVNVLFKNFADLCVGVLFFYIIGYSLMYGDDITGIGLIPTAVGIESFGIPKSAKI